MLAMLIAGFGALGLLMLRRRSSNAASVIEQPRGASSGAAFPRGC
jgi:hypothetical protein